VAGRNSDVYQLRDDLIEASGGHCDDSAAIASRIRDGGAQR
jgi:hypothetical protein